MEFTYELTKEDFIHFNVYHIENTPRGKKSIMMQRFISPIVFLIAPFLAIRISDNPLSFWFSIFGGLYLLWVVIFPTYFSKSIRKRISKMIDKGAGGDILGYHDMKISDEGIEAVNQRTKAISSSSWTDINSMKEIEKYIYVYRDSMSAFIIPKGYLEEEDKNQLIDKIQNYIESNEKEEEE